MTRHIVCFTPPLKLLACVGAIIVYILTSAVPADSMESENSLSLGYKAYQTGNFEKAIEYLEAAGKDDRILSDYARYYLGEAYLSLHRFDEALHAFKSCIDAYGASPLVPSARERIGDIYLAKGDITSSINAYKGLLTKYSDNTQTPRILHKLISALLLNNRQDEAVPFMKKLLTEFAQTGDNDDSFTSQILSGEVRKLDAEEFSTRAKALLKTRNCQKAIDEIKMYLSEGPPWFPREVPLKRNDRLLLLLGQALYQTRNYKTANEIFKEIFSHTSDGKLRIESLIWLARGYSRLKDAESARNVLKNFIAVYADNIPGLKVRDYRDEAIYRLAMIAKDEGDSIKAVVFFKQLLKENPLSSHRNNVLWQISWIYYGQGNLEESLETLKSLENSQLRMRALYWEGKISLMLGKKDNALRLFKTAAESFPPTYYSVSSKRALEGISGYELQIADFRISNQESEVRNSPGSLPINPVRNSPDKKPFAFSNNLPPTEEASNGVKRTRRLLELGLSNLALKELASMDHRQDPLNISLLYQQAGDFYHSYLFARNHFSHASPLTFELAYPQDYKEMVEKVAGEFQLAPFLIYAVMMQESEFDDKAVSNLGAVGLLQIMPGTGEMIAKKLSFGPLKQDDLFAPSTNINFGAWYLKTLISRYKGNLPFAIAAYNAGPNAVDEWLKKWGRLDMDEFVENIPYQETRKYVEKVMGYYEAYKAIYSRHTHFGSNAGMDARTAKKDE